MTLGVQVRTRLARVPKGIPVETGTLFVTGAATSGSATAAAECHNMADFEAAYGVRAVGNQALYDYVDAAFGEGVTRAFVARKGTVTAAVDEKQTITETGATGGTFTLTFSGQTTTALAYGATAAVVVAALEALSTIGVGGVTGTGGPLNTTPVVITFAGTRAGQDQPLMTANGAALTGTTPTIAVAVTQQGAVAGGSLDAALLLFLKDLGPGQVAAVGETSNATTFDKLLTHALNNNRFALLDVGSADDVAAMTTLGGTLAARSATLKDRGALFGPWAEIPPPVGVAGSSGRTVPASAVVAGLCARVDAAGNPNRAAAGRDYPCQYATGIVLDAAKSDRESLLDAGVNTMAVIYGVLENYGFQTAITADPNNPYWQANACRARMWITARAEAAGEPFVFRPIDGQGKLAGALRGAIDAILLELYGVDGLYGETPGEAFATTVNATINPPTEIAQGTLHAVSEVRFSMHAKAVIIDLVTVPITGSIS
jgi:hypothetical protein